MILLYFQPLDHLETDQFLSEKIYVSVTKNIDLTDENGHLIHSISIPTLEN